MPQPERTVCVELTVEEAERKLERLDSISSPGAVTSEMAELLRAALDSQEDQGQVGEEHVCTIHPYASGAVATCTCGWRGIVRGHRIEAEREAEAHQASVTAAPAGTEEGSRRAGAVECDGSGKLATGESNVPDPQVEQGEPCKRCGGKRTVETEYTCGWITEPCPLCSLASTQSQPDQAPEGESDDSDREPWAGVANIAWCRKHGLHGARSHCFECREPVEQIPMVPLRDLEPVRGTLRSLAGGPKAAPVSLDRADALLAQAEGMAQEATDELDRLAEGTQPTDACEFTRRGAAKR